MAKAESPLEFVLEHLGVSPSGAMPAFQQEAIKSGPMISPILGSKPVQFNQPGRSYSSPSCEPAKCVGCQAQDVCLFHAGGCDPDIPSFCDVVVRSQG